MNLHFGARNWAKLQVSTMTRRLQTSWNDRNDPPMASGNPLDHRRSTTARDPKVHNPAGGQFYRHTVPFELEEINHVFNAVNLIDQKHIIQQGSKSHPIVGDATKTRPRTRRLSLSSGTVSDIVITLKRPEQGFIYPSGLPPVPPRTSSGFGTL